MTKRRVRWPTIRWRAILRHPLLRRPVRWRTVGLALVLAAWGFGVLLAVCESFPVEHREPLTVRVLNGQNGQPLVHLQLALSAGYTGADIEKRLWRDEVVTDAAGEARVPRVLSNLPFLRVKVKQAKLCQGTVTYTVERIRGEGLNAPNHCGFVTVAEAPGVLVVFARGNAGQEGTEQAPAREPRIDFAVAASPDSETRPNELGRGSAASLMQARNELHAEAGRALASVAASIGTREAETRPGRAETRTPNEIDSLMIWGRTGFSEPIRPVLEGTGDAAESYETMCQPED